VLRESTEVPIRSISPGGSQWWHEFNRVLAGDVLVAPAITPAWTQLFGRVAAVADTGGQGSNSSVVAREYGIPSVVGTRNATARLRDGQVVMVDGNEGVVRISA
jgi:rifampicin phosphotransferase